MGKHGVSEAEVVELFESENLEYHVGEGKWICVGQTETGRFLQIIWTKAEDEQGAYKFVITAYPPTKDIVRAFRRYLKKRNKR